MSKASFIEPSFSPNMKSLNYHTCIITNKLVGHTRDRPVTCVTCVEFTHTNFFAIIPRLVQFYTQTIHDCKASVPAHLLRPLLQKSDWPFRSYIILCNQKSSQNWKLPWFVYKVYGKWFVNILKTFWALKLHLMMLF